MKNKLNTDGVIKLLETDRFLSNYISIAPPQAILMPFAQEHHKTYLMIALFLCEQHCNRSILVSICKRVLELLKIEGLLNGLDGVEIMPCIVKEEKTVRVFRLSILSEALKRAESLDEQDILQAEPSEGITCILYQKDL